MAPGVGAELGPQHRFFLPDTGLVAVTHVAEEVARLRGISLDELTQATTTNFLRLFGPKADA